MEQTLFAKLKWQFILILARRLPDCKTITPKLGESLDRKLTRRERIVNRLHLFTCEACQRYLEQIKFLHKAMLEHEAFLKAEAENSTATLGSDTKERLKKALSSPF